MKVKCDVKLILIMIFSNRKRFLFIQMTYSVKSSPALTDKIQSLCLLIVGLRLYSWHYYIRDTFLYAKRISDGFKIIRIQLIFIFPVLNKECNITNDIMNSTLHFYCIFHTVWNPHKVPTLRKSSSPSTFDSTPHSTIGNYYII